MCREARRWVSPRGGGAQFSFLTSLGIRTVEFIGGIRAERNAACL